MRLAVISFTGAGAGWCRILVKRFRETGADCEGYVQPRFFSGTGSEQPGIKPVTEGVGAWTERWFFCADGLIYIGAVGIAVRAVAPFLADKLKDPAVVVMDEAGHHVVSLLSGHVGGANELTRAVAKICGADPVITTATDVRGKTAIDLWAAARGLAIGDRKQAKQVAAALLEDKRVGFFSDFPFSASVPPGCIYGAEGEQNVWLTVRKSPMKGEEPLARLCREGRLLPLIPRLLFLGIGCRKGISEEQIRETAEKVLDEAGLERQGVACLASIDLKKEEEGINRLAKRWEVPYVTFSSRELEAVRGSVSESPFVRQITGTGNVCERAALAAAGAGGRLVVKKQAEAGVTVAVALGRGEGQAVWQG